MDMIGIISDTHDNKDAIMKIVEILNKMDIDLIFHAGDHIAPFTVRWMSRFNAEVIGVAGNNDGETKLLKKFYEDNGWRFEEFLAEIEYKGKKIVLTHGTYPKVVEALYKSGLYDIVVYGHTHEVYIGKYGDTRVINPGEACGYLTGRRTIAVYDVDRDEVRIIDL